MWKYVSLSGGHFLPGAGKNIAISRRPAAA